MKDFHDSHVRDFPRDESPSITDHRVGLESELESESVSDLSSELESESVSDLSSELESECVSDLSSELESEIGSDLPSELESEIEPFGEALRYVLQKEDEGKRIDVILGERFPEHSRSFYKDLLTGGAVTLGGRRVTKPSLKGKAGEEIVAVLPRVKELVAVPQNIPLDILYEDEDVLVVNKPKGMVVHPAPGHEDRTLVNAVLYHCQGRLSGINGVLRPGIVHRIDQDTTGVLVVCKNDRAHQSLSAQLEVHSITRKYRAVVAGTFKEESFTVDAPLGRHPVDRKRMAVVKNGKRAVTHVRVLETFQNASYVECTLETGRTHQIRVHLSSLGHPLLGDQVYGSGKNPYHLQGQALHAMVLGFIHPSTGEYVEFEAPLPEYFEALLEKLRLGRSRS